jgi:hypothetical protein
MSHSAASEEIEADEPGESGSGKSGAVRPDEMSAELMRFLAAIDHLKREQRGKQVLPADLFRLLGQLGYTRAGRKPSSRAFCEAYTRAYEEYRRKSKRLFPSWSEAHALLLGLGWNAPAARPPERRQESA